MQQDFVKPHLEGQRFADHSIPLELLKDFSALEEMLIAVAKWEYLRENPGRERVTKNFSRGLELKLAQVEEGSAIAAIVLSFSTLIPSHTATYLERARTQVIEAIASAADGQQPALPSQFLAYFDRLGRGLRDDESMSFTRNNGTAARLTPTVRKRLIDAAHIQSWSEEIFLRGKVCEFDPARGSFELELRDGSKVKAPLHEQHREAIFEAARSYPDNDYILVQAIALKDRASKLKSIQTVEQISDLDPMDVGLRLDELSQLQSGWLNGKGRGFDRGRLDKLVAQFDRFYPGDLSLPHIYPTAEGGVQAEWSIGTWEVSLEIDVGSLLGDYQAFNIASRECKEIAINLNIEEGWVALRNQLTQIEGVQV
jgi:hypothetical protein